MKQFSFSSIVLFGSFAVSALAQERLPVNNDLTKPDPATNKRLTNYWAKSTCYKRGDGTEPNMKEQCKKVCFPSPDPKKTSASTCLFGDAKWLDGSSGKPLGEQNKNIPKQAIKGGHCSCNDPIILFTGDFFIKAVTEAGKVIEKVVCPALQALDIVIEVGMIAIPPPGKAIQGGMIAAIRTAKAYKYAYNAQDAAQEWANMIFGGLSLSKEAGCGEPPFSISKLVSKFLDFANVPDATLPGGIDYATLPCPKGGCKGTKQSEKQNDDTKTKSTATSSSVMLSASPKPGFKFLKEKLQRAERRDAAERLHSRRTENRESH
ncbi:hypothetical protein CC80DRAFT_589491 [Byssothecium circinans]|uniref:Uncharacterized protein n=1 Tax=Byssothecium circinans TaxID=147558 RepID=A0A6A5UE87_9PLEO|nr:hypothetical protein CC80DRAFT_589491 [Byssothecium circinans]